MDKVKVTAATTFIGTPEEVEAYGGQVPSSMKKAEKKMSEAERSAFAGKIHEGAVLEVTTARAKALAKAGLIHEADKYASDEDATEKQTISTSTKEKAEQTHTSKSKTEGIPTAKKSGKKGGR